MKGRSGPEELTVHRSLGTVQESSGSNCQPSTGNCELMTALVAADEEMGYARAAAVQAASRQLARQARRDPPAPAPRPWAPEYRWASGALCLNLGLALLAAQSAALVAHGLVALGILGAGQAL